MEVEKKEDTGASAFWLGLIWQGKAPLSMTFWLVSVVIAGGIRFGFKVLALKLPMPLAVILGGITAAYCVFFIVSLWRSASRYQGHKLWAGLARGYAIAAVLVALLPTVVTTLQIAKGELPQRTVPVHQSPWDEFGQRAPSPR